MAKTAHCDGVHSRAGYAHARRADPNGSNDHVIHERDARRPVSVSVRLLTRSSDDLTTHFHFTGAALSISVVPIVDVDASLAECQRRMRELHLADLPVLRVRG